MKNSKNKKLKIIAMIPARLNSKRVKKKNLRLINNKPLISYIIEIQQIEHQEQQKMIGLKK